MADDPEFPQVSNESIDSIRARMAARANLGIDPGSQLYQDVTLGSMLGDLAAAVGLDLDESYDFGNEVVRAASPLTTYGEWLDGWAAALGLERKPAAKAGGTVTFTGTNGTVIPIGTTVGQGTVSDDGEAVAVATLGAVTIASGTAEANVEATAEGSAGNVGPNTLTVPGSSIAGLASVTNQDPLTGGADIESDEQLGPRVLLELGEPRGGGTQADYTAWALAESGVGFATVEPTWDGPGTVRVWITDTNNDPVPAPVVASLQDRLDPTPGAGEGQAPIGHEVTVDTPTSAGYDVVAVVVPESGYSVDGAGDTEAIEDAVVAAIRSYIDSLPVGHDIVRSKLIGAIVAVRGVADFTTLTVNGSAAATVAVADDAVAFSDDVTVT